MLESHLPLPTRCGSSKNVSSKEMVKPWIFVNCLCFFKLKCFESEKIQGNKEMSEKGTVKKSKN